MPADTLLPATTSTGRSAQADRFPCKRQSRTVFQHRSGTLDIPLRGLGRLRKYNAGLRSRTFGSRNPALRISKGTMPAAYRRRLYCDYGCDFGYDDAPGPGCRDYPRHDLLRGGTPHSQPRRHLLQVPDRHSSHRRVHGSDHVPAASVSATARPTASPAAAMTGKSGGVIFRACTYGFRQGQFRISRSINSSIRWNLPCSSSFTNVTARPVALARAVRPMRWI